MKIKIKIQFILFIFSILINIIISKDFCENITPVYTFEDTHCDSDFYTVVNPTVYINNLKDYDTVLVVPEPIARSYISYNNYAVILDFGKSYNFTFVNNKCTQNPVANFTTKSGPNFKITNPICAGSQSTIDFIPDPSLKGTVYTFTMKNNNITLPIQLKAPEQYEIEALIDGVTQCKATLNLKGSNITGPQPIVIVTSPICGQSNGAIKIENYKNFTKIVVNSTIPITPTSPGVYSGLSKGTYKITTTDSQCGERYHTTFIYDAIPPYHIEFVDFSCPISPLVKLIINTTESYEILNGQEPVSNPFYANSNDVFYAKMSCATFELQLNLPSSYPLIQYTYEDSNFCQPYTISLVGFNSSAFPNLKIISQDEISVSLDANSSFVASYGDLYSISDSCYDSELIIGRTYPKPIIKYLNESNYCKDYIDIQVYNFLDFYYIALIPFDGESPSSTFKYSMSSDGYFRNVSNQQLLLEYQYRSCSDILRYTIGNMNRMDNSTLDVKFNITSYPTCNYLFGMADVEMYKKNTTELVASFSQQFFYYSKGATVNFYTDFEFNCDASVSGIDLGDFVFKQASVNVSTAIKPVCRYSQGSGLRIDSDTEILTIVINGKQVYPYDTNGSSVYVYGEAGNHTIELRFARSTECQPMTIYHWVEPLHNFTFNYQTTNVTTCLQKPDGAIFIEGWNNFTLLTINSNPYIPGPDFWLEGLSSKSYSIDFVKTFDDNSTCTGVAHIFVPSMHADISYTIINQPLCSSDSSGSVSFDYASNFPNQPNRMPIDLVYQGQILYTGNVADNFLPGTYIFNVSSGNCAWELPVTFNEVPIDITYKQLWYYIDDDCQIQAGYQFSANNSLATNSLKAYSIYFTSDGGLIYGEIPTSTFDIDVYYAPNSVCEKTFTFSYDDYYDITYPKLQYTIIRKPNCMSADQTFDIKITNPSDWSYLVVGNMTMDSNGVIKGVAPYMQVYGLNSKTNCYLSDIYDDVSYNNNIVTDKIISSETCHGSKNGQIEFTDDQYGYYPFTFDSNSGGNVLLPLLNSQNKNKFKQITSEQVFIELVGKNILTSTCKQYDSATITGNEPSLVENIEDQCSTDGLGSINIETSLQGLNVSAYFSTGNSEELFNGTLNNAKPGTYNLVNFKVTTDYCRRSFGQIDVKIGASIFSLNVDSSTCESVIIKPSIITSTYPNTPIYHYNFTSTLNETIQYNQSGPLTVNSLADFGQYKLVVSDGHCIQTHVFNFTQCPNEDDGGVNLGLAIGLPIGLVGLGAIIAASVFFYRKRKSPIKANDLPPLSHEMETVSTFQGGRIVEIDKF
ncbi:hypothetical protein RB653_008595 [Dictyostelium firmibasis]|uniref:TgrB1 n=1 Tax=Dictyostelium firmibasis TaxID=79012 RepID=A0AAN7U0K7_9MYCE